MPDVWRLESRTLSGFKTHHVFENYGEFRSADEYIKYYSWAQGRGLPVFILGNGSNTLFRRKHVRTLVLRNRIPPTMDVLDETHIEASSSLQIMQLLKYCEPKNLDSFYFLASVPATVGGAIAMNAGAGVGPTIFDFVESITFIEEGRIRTLSEEQVARSHRTTRFTGVHGKLIVSARFRFPVASETTEGKILERTQWSLNHQDRNLPNCGSVFKECDHPFFRWLCRVPPRGLSIPGFRAQYSRRTRNWIINTNRSSWAIMTLIRLAVFVHRLCGRKIELEIILVD